jgi:hypothetical protein
VHKTQPLEFDYLAPDTVEEIFTALELLETWTATAALYRDDQSPDGVPPAKLRTRGRALLLDSPTEIATLDVLGEAMENSPRPVRILKAERGYACYRDMVHYYAIHTLVGFIQARPLPSFAALKECLGPARRAPWTNLGGQLALTSDVDALKQRIRAGELASWDAVHDAYQQLWSRYPEDKARHALASWAELCGCPPERLDRGRWLTALDRAVATQRWIAEQVYASRAKDYTSPFRLITFDSPAEVDAVLGSIDDNDFIRQTRAETDQFAQTVAALKQRAT